VVVQRARGRYRCTRRLRTVRHCSARRCDSCVGRSDLLDGQVQCELGAWSVDPFFDLFVCKKELRSCFSATEYSIGLNVFD